MQDAQNKDTSYSKSNEKVDNENDEDSDMEDSDSNQLGSQAQSSMMID